MSAILDRLTGMLDVSPADLAALDEEIALLRAVRDLVARAVSARSARPPEPAPTVAEAQPAGKAERPARQPPPGGASAAAEGARARRLEIARLLASAPRSPSAIIAATGIPKGSITGLLSHPWFARQTTEKFSPYQLTDEGRAALASADTVATPAIA